MAVTNLVRGRHYKILKIGVVSDTHLGTSTPALKKAIKDYFHNAEIVLHAGDICSPGVLDLFKGTKLFAVSGNSDSKEIRSRFPEKQVIRAGTFRIGLVHGWGSPIGLEKRVRKLFRDVDCIVFGHSHLPVNHLREGILMFNPGAFKRGLFSLCRRTIGILEIGTQLKGTIIRL